MEDKIISGMATIFWGTAWADHAEEHGCCSLAGCKIEDIMPPIPSEARELAQRLVGKIEGANGCDLWKLYARALEADGLDYTTHGDAHAERFGECLAYEAMGAGVSWTDDHEEYAHVEVSIEYHHLMSLADAQCATPKRYRLQARAEGAEKFQTIERANNLEDLRWGWQQFLTPAFVGTVRIVERTAHGRKVVQRLAQGV